MSGLHGDRDPDPAALDELQRAFADETGYLLRSEVRLVGFDDVDPLSFEEQR